MSNKKRTKKGIESLKERIEEHEIKLGGARKEEKPELAGYYEKEISHLEWTKKRLENKIKPKRKRKKF